MAISLAYSTSSITSDEKSFAATSKWQPYWKCQNIKHNFNLTSDVRRSSQTMPEKVFFMVMTPSITTQGNLKLALYIHV